MGDIKIVNTGSCYDCGGRCVIRPHVKDGVVIRVESDTGEDPQIRACARGRALRQHLYSPDRLKYPQKRVGERGEGRFERISWDEALDTVARQLKRVKETYGSAAILGMSLSGNAGQVHSSALLYRFLNLFGGCTRTWGGASAEASVFANRCTFGTLTTGNTRDDLVNSRLIIMWGWNPAVSIWGTNTTYWIARAKEAGARIICVDPRFTDSAATFAARWIPIRPGTDTAMLAAMAHVMIQEKRHHQDFLDKYTVGFDRYRDYVLGKDDGVPKTPAWAEPITGVPAATISELAREFATTRPAALIPSYAPGRTAYGEQFHRATATLAAMTGNIGIHGGGAGGFERGPVGSMVGQEMPEGKNPIEAGLPSLRGSLDFAKRSRPRTHNCLVWDAILEGKAGGGPADLKLLYVVATNMLNQFFDVNKGVRALRKLEFIVVHEQFMTATARFADILLPANSLWERTDLARPWVSGPYYVYMNRVIDTMYESKSDFHILSELAQRLGFTYSDRPEEEWVKEVFRLSPDVSRDVPDYAAFQRDGVYKMKLDGPLVALQPQIDDPEHHPFPTPSGKIEIYSQQLADMGNPEVPPIPKYLPTWEGPADPLAKEYPLQLVSIHHKRRAHSNFENTPWLKSLERDGIFLSAEDARARGIRDGDQVRVFNGRGQMIVPCIVTERIMPGVVSLGEGAWYRPDGRGVDRGGCPNVLFRARPAPGGGWPTNTCLVQVAKTQEE